MTVRFYAYQGGGFDTAKTFSTSFKNMGFSEHLFTFDPSKGDNLKKVISAISFYIFMVRDGVCEIAMGTGNAPIFLTLDAYKIYFGEEARKESTIWGNEKYYQYKDQLLTDDLKELAIEYSTIFDPGELGNFVYYHNEGETSAAKPSPEMLRYVWMKFWRGLMRDLTGVRSSDLLDGDGPKDTGRYDLTVYGLDSTGEGWLGSGGGENPNLEK